MARIGPLLLAGLAVEVAAGCAAGPAPDEPGLGEASKAEATGEEGSGAVEVTILDALPTDGSDGPPVMVTIRASQEGDEGADPCRLAGGPTADLLTCRARQFADCSTSPSVDCLATAAGLGHTATLGSVPANLAGDAISFQARLPRGAMRGGPVLGLLQFSEAIQSGELERWWTEVLPARMESILACGSDPAVCWEQAVESFMEGLLAPTRGNYPSVLRSESTAGSDFVVKDLLGQLTIFSRRDDCGQIPPAPLTLLPYQLTDELEKFVCCDPDLERDSNLICHHRGEADQWDPDTWLRFLSRTINDDFGYPQRSWGKSQGLALARAFHQRLTSFLDREKEDPGDPYSLCLCKEVVQQ